MDSKMTVMIVEDDRVLADEIRQFLEKWGYEAFVAKRFDGIAAEYSDRRPHLILMDITLPFYDGYYWCSRIRESSDVPILFISSRSDDRDKIMAIAQGGDDYVEKPFHLELLKAKIEAVLRRTYRYKVRERICLGEDVYFETETSALFCHGKELELTRSEKKIMSKLLDCRAKVITREELMMELWSTDEFVSDGTLTTLVCRLRNKLRESCGSEIIGTKKGQGYFIA